MGFMDPNSWANALSDDPTGAKYAAQMSQQSAANSLALQKEQSDYQRQIMDPYIQAGAQRQQDLMQATGAGGKFNQYGMNEFMQGPEYQLAMGALQQGNQGINAQAAASGSFGNPAVQSAIQQQMAAGLGNAFQQGRGNWMEDYNKLVGQAQPGPAQQLAAMAGQYAANAGNTMTNAGQYQGNAAMQGAASQNAMRGNAIGSLDSYANKLGNFFTQQNGGWGSSNGTIDNYDPNTAYSGQTAGPWAAGSGTGDFTTAQGYNPFTDS